MSKKTKNLFLCLAIAFFCLKGGLIAYSTTYKIDSVDYDLTGKTKPYALEQKVTIDKNRIFESEAEYNEYFQDILQQLNNQRVFDSASITDTMGGQDENGVVLVHWLITAKDTKNFLMLPYPKYDSNDGFKIKLTAKDYNFFGSMNAMSFNTSFYQDKDDDTGDTDYVIGAGLSFDYPFKLAVFDSEWQNDFSIDHTFGNSAPEFDLNTGLMFSLPFDTFKLQLTLIQSLSRDEDYIKYNDSVYATEKAKLAVPIKLADITNWGEITYTPYISARMFWDTNGIDDLNKDLTSPRYEIGHGVSTGRIDWYGNFRQGFSIELTQSMYYDTQKKDIVPNVCMQTQTHLNWHFAGPSMRTYFFGYTNGSEKIGERLRGIRDDQYYENLDDEKALDVSAAIVFNCDLPIKIIQTDWDGWGLAIFNHIIQPIFHCSDHPNLPTFFDILFYVPKKLFHYCDFELQISPFCDFALTTNKETHDTFNYKDGFYAGGLEVLIYPSRWRSIQIRASAGADIGRILLGSAINKDFRNLNTSKFELYIGLGLFF